MAFSLVILILLIALPTPIYSLMIYKNFSKANLKIQGIILVVSVFFMYICAFVFIPLLMEVITGLDKFPYDLWVINVANIVGNIILLLWQKILFTFYRKNEKVTIEQMIKDIKKTALASINSKKNNKSIHYYFIWIPFALVTFYISAQLVLDKVWTTKKGVIVSISSVVLSQLVTLIFIAFCEFFGFQFYLEIPRNILLLLFNLIISVIVNIMLIKFLFMQIEKNSASKI